LRFSKRVRTDRRRAKRDEVYVRDFLPSSFNPDLLDDLIRIERSRAVARAWQVLAPRTRLVLDAVILKGLPRRAAAALLGLTERIVKRELDEGRPQLALMLPEWDPHAARSRRRGAPTDNERGEYE
jgi:DNA-directed RNA polymerase specialized sigma24 family protein